MGIRRIQLGVCHTDVRENAYVDSWRACRCTGSQPDQVTQGEPCLRTAMSRWSGFGKEPSSPRLSAATSHRQASRLSAAASSHASALDKYAWAYSGKLSDGSYGVGSSCTTDKVVELGK
jgi:hypothetical protein